MNLPPYLIRMRIEPVGRPPFRLWLPLFLLWPLLLVLVVLSLVLTILVDVVLWVAGQEYHYYTYLLVNALGVLAETKGTSVHIHDANEALIDIVVQ